MREQNFSKSEISHKIWLFFFVKCSPGLCSRTAMPDLIAMHAVSVHLEGRFVRSGIRGLGTFGGMAAKPPRAKVFALPLSNSRADWQHSRLTLSQMLGLGFVVIASPRKISDASFAEKKKLREILPAEAQKDRQRELATNNGSGCPEILNRFSPNMSHRCQRNRHVNSERTANAVARMCRLLLRLPP